MKIGIVTQTYYPYPGGVTEHVHSTYMVLRRLGNDVKIITTSYGGGAKEDEGEDIIRIGRAIPVLANGSVCPVVVSPGIAGEFRQILRAERFDILHVHEPLMPFLCQTAVREADVPVIGTFHASNERPLGYRLFRAPLDRLLRRLSRRIAVSDAARGTVSAYFGGEYSLIPNGVDVERFASADPLGKLEDDAFNILFVGRMEPRKGLKFLLKAFPLISEEVPSSRLVVVGGGHLAWIYRLHRPRRCENRVLFEGAVSKEALPRYYASADVYCSPATGGESFGIVLLEAMAAGAATVASDIPGYRAVIEHGVDGVLVEPRSPGALAEGIIGLARDHDLRSRLAEEGRRTVERYSWDKVTREILDVYEEALGVSRAGAGAPRETRRSAPSLHVCGKATVREAIDDES